MNYYHTKKLKIKYQGGDAEQPTKAEFTGPLAKDIVNVTCEKHNVKDQYREDKIPSIKSNRAYMFELMKLSVGHGKWYITRFQRVSQPYRMY